MNAVLPISRIDIAFNQALARRDWPEAERMIRTVTDHVAKFIHPKPRRYLDIPRKPVRKVHPIVYLPVEIKSREWASKIKIARVLVRQGFNVVIGQSWAVQKGGYAGWPPGIVLFKTLNGYDGKMMHSTIANGHLIAALDEEALTRTTSTEWCRLNTDPWAAACADLICAQGPSQAEALKSVYPDVKIVITGNPRADEFEIIGERPRGMALLCCMSGNILNTRGISTNTYSTLALGAHAGLDFAKHAYVEACLYELKTLPLLLERATELCKRYRRVVIRPHPVESWGFWKHQILEENATVTNAGPVKDWMKQAEEIITVDVCGCTAEAKLMGLNPSVVSISGIEPVYDFIRGDASERITDAILKLWLSHQLGGPVPELNRQSGFEPEPFHVNKFPPTSLDSVRAEFDRPVVRIEDNVFHVKP